MSSPYFFVEEFANRAYLNQPIGLEGPTILILDQDCVQKEWVLKPIPSHEILDIRITRCRSHLSLLIAFLSCVVAVCVAYVMIKDFMIEKQIWHPKSLLWPLVATAAAYWFFINSHSIRFEFTVDNSKYVLTDLERKLIPAISTLRDWAATHHVRCTIDFPIELTITPTTNPDAT